MGDGREDREHEDEEKFFRGIHRRR
jgi:hypothetical protein